MTLTSRERFLTVFRNLASAFCLVWMIQSIRCAASSRDPELTVYPAVPNNQYASELYEVMVAQGPKKFSSYVCKSTRDAGKPYQLFGIRTKLASENGPALASYREGLGSVDGIVFRNITAAQEPLHPSVFDGNGDEPGTIANVTFENLRIAGTLVTESNASAYVVQRGKTSGFRYGPAGQTQARSQSRKNRK